MPGMLGSFERKVGPWFIYKGADFYLVVDTRLPILPGSDWWSCVWGTMPLTFNIWQNIGQLKIWFLANEDPVQSLCRHVP